MRRHAFRGCFAWEVQVGPVVVQVRHYGRRQGDWRRVTGRARRPVNAWLDR